MNYNYFQLIQFEFETESFWSLSKDVEDWKIRYQGKKRLVIKPESLICNLLIFLNDKAVTEEMIWKKTDFLLIKSLTLLSARKIS